MYDGSELAGAVAASPEDPEGALARYEAGMFARAADEAAESARMQELMYGEDAPQSIVGFFISAVQGG